MPRLPNWKLLTAFEAVARHRSFSRAADELNVLQPAVSRRVAELEAELEVQLLLRTRPMARLTPEGEVLYRALSTSLVQVEGAVAQITERDGKRPVVVNLTIGFANCFLLRRLGAFRQAHPDCEISLVSRDLNENRHDPGADIVIAFESPEHLPGLERRRIFGEEMIAVAAPGLIEAAPLAPARLAEERLLHLGAGSHRDDWDTFVAGLGVALPPPQPALTYTSFMVYLQAALNGDGIAVGWIHLLDDHIGAGQLQVVSDHRVTTERGYYCCLTRAGMTTPGARAFSDWICGLIP